jgi:hypothetical protein
MGTIGFISRMKDSFRQLQQNKSQEDNIKRTEELQELKQKRVMLEGKANLERLKQDEIRRISEAKQTVAEGSKFHKFMKVVEGLRKVQSSPNNQGNKTVKITKGLQRVQNSSQGVFSSQSRGLEIGNKGIDLGSSKKQKSPFDFGGN